MCCVPALTPISIIILGGSRRALLPSKLIPAAAPLFSRTFDFFSGHLRRSVRGCGWRRLNRAHRSTSRSQKVRRIRELKAGSMSAAAVIRRQRPQRVDGRTCPDRQGLIKGWRMWVWVCPPPHTSCLKEILISDLKAFKNHFHAPTDSSRDRVPAEALRRTCNPTRLRSEIFY